MQAREEIRLPEKPLRTHCARRRSWRRWVQLTAGVAHDFNNLLTVILGNLEFMARASADDAQHASDQRRRRWIADRGSLASFWRSRAVSGSSRGLSISTRS